MVGQLNGQLVESRISILQDVKLKTGRTTVRVSGDNYAIRETRTPLWKAACVEKSHAIPFPKNSDGMSPSGSSRAITSEHTPSATPGAVRNMPSPRISWAGYRQTHRSGFYLKLPEELTEGATFDYAILYTTGGSLPHRPASDYQKIRSFLGFTGAISRARGH